MARDPSKCNEEIHERGICIGVFDMPKAEAEALADRLTEETGFEHDWHYVGGRVVMKVLPEHHEQIQKNKEAAGLGVWS